MITETESQEVEFKLIQMDWLIFYYDVPDDIAAGRIM